MHKLATNPALMARFMATGKAPIEVRVTSPLIELLERMGARDRSRIRGVRLSWKVGYLSTAKFSNGEALLRWLKPSETVLATESWPAETCRVKGFRGPARLQDLLECCDVYPEEMLQRDAAKEGRG